MQWYVSQKGRTSGPFSEARIEMLVNWGKISHEAYICDEKWSCWISVMRSHFAPLLIAQGHEPRRDSQAPGADEPSGAGNSLWQRVALAVLVILAAAAFLLALWLAPDSGVPGPLGQTWAAAPYTTAPGADTNGQGPRG